MKILVTGAAGFIGSALMRELARRGDSVVGLDNINDYYDVRLKYGRLALCGFDVSAGQMPWGEMQTGTLPDCRFIRMGIDDKPALDALFASEKFDAVLNLAAQAGVRHSISNPYDYLQSNVTGFLNVLEACRHNGVKHLVFASSSSVYGLNSQVPYNEADRTDTPVSLYAATKKSNELMAHSYASLYGIPCTGLRYFTVYGPWGRPDMSPMLFADAITEGKPLNVFNHGDMIRDFTYIDDVVEGTIRVLDNPPAADGVPYRLFNIGCSTPVKLMDFIAELEKALGKEAVKNMLPMQPGDVYQTNADTARLEAAVGYRPHISLHEGIGHFVQWYLSDKNPLR
jgi:UDP-glucuronate 4-epimerase